MIESLTPAERMVLGCLVDGLCLKEIAAKRGCTRQAVSRLTTKAALKLGARGPHHAAIIYALGVK